MSGKPKLTKFLLARGLERFSNITEIARELGVSRYTIYRSMKRWGVDVATLLKQSATHPDTAAVESKRQPQTTQVQAVESKDAVAKPEPERNVMRLPISDFTGPHRGDTGGSLPGQPSSPDELLNRYHSLKHGTRRRYY